MDLVINEWFPEYCKVETAKKDKEILRTFLEKFLQKKDVLYVRRPSPFLYKIYSYAKEYQSHQDTYTIKLLTFFIKNVINDSSRCVLIDEECNLDETILEKLAEGNYSSDTYLFEAASKTNSKFVITTDGKLCRHMKDVATYNVVSLSDFLKEY